MIREAFSRAADKPEGSSGGDFLEAILRERPDLKGKPVYFPGQGNNAHTVFIGEEVFKGPRQPSVFGGFDNFDREHGALKKLEGKSLPVPRVTCVGEEAVFFGMTRMPGISLSAHIQAMTQDELKMLAKDTAAALSGMAEGFSAEDAKSLGILQGTLYPEVCREAVESTDVQAVLGGRLARCQLLVKQYEYICASKEPVFMPGDLHEENILIDPDTKKLTGIIDLGVTGYRIPEAESNPLWNYPDEFVDAFCEEYSSRGVSEISRRNIILFRLADDLKTLHHYVTKGYESDVRVTLEKIDRNLEKIAKIDTAVPPSSPKKPVFNP